MSQFGPKNPAAWARPPGSSQQLNPGLFQNPLINAQPFAQMGMINAAAFSQQAANMGVNLGMLQSSPQQLRMQSQQQPQQKNRTFSGVVTKIHDTYGFIDDDVFFQVSVVRGALPRSGDRVMVEAAYNPSMPFKWNAFRVQLINDKGSSGGGSMHSPTDRGRSSLGVRALPSEQSWGNSSLEKATPLMSTNPQRSRNSRTSPMRQSLMQGRHRSPLRGSGGQPVPMSDLRRSSPPRRISSPQRIISQRSPKRSPNRGDNSSKGQMRATSARKHESSKREHSSSVTARNQSPSSKRENTGRDSQSPPRRRPRVVPRYQCYTPKTPIPGVDTPLTVIQLRKRHPSMYIPSDFIQASMEWPKIVPIENAISFSTSPVVFNVLHKNVDCPGAEADDFPMLNPPDADLRFSAKVVLMSHPGLSAIQQKAFGLLADGSFDDGIDPMPLSRCFSFLVGTRGKEMMAIGGPWSPSLDGENPEKDPQVLVRTAIRTVRALTGIDLSNCSRWYKMAELRYYRAEKDRMDTCTLMLPDTCGLMPESDEVYQQQVAVLRDQLNAKIEALEQLKPEPQQPDEVEVVAVVAATSELSSTADTTTQQSGEGNSQSDQLEQTDQTSDTNKEQVEEVQEEDDEEELNPTHWSKLDVKSMKVAELRQELMARDLETKGVKTVLCNRLQQAIDQEQLAENGKEVKDDDQDEVMILENPESKLDEEVKEEKELTEKEKELLEKWEKEKSEKKCTLERHYLVPRKCGVLVYPNRTAKCGKFDCKVATLHTLLDYRVGDIKEHSFELAVMAECISEMLDRAQAFATYRVVSCALDKDSEKKRRDDTKVAEALGHEDKSAVQADEAKTTDVGLSAEGDAKASEEAKKEEEKREEEKRKIITEPRKVIITDRLAFQAFAHFDQNLCGYLMERDLDEIWHSMGLNLSRSQLSKTMKKVLSRDRILYRNLTDSWVNKDGTVTYKPGVCDDSPTINALSKGNVLRSIGEASGDQRQNSAAVSNGSVTFNGTIMNIPELLEQLSQMETLRNTTLQTVDVLEGQLKDGSKTTQMLEKKKKRLEDDVEKYRKRLHDAEKSLKTSLEDSTQMRTAVQEFRKIGERMVVMAEKYIPTPKEPEKVPEKSAKSVKKEKKEEKDDKQVIKKKEEKEPKVNGETEEKKELQLVDEVGGSEEPMETDIVLSEEVADDDDKEAKVEATEQ